MMVHNLAVQTLDTFVRMDVSFRRNRLYRTFVSTYLAGITAHFITAQPVENAEPRRNGNSRPQRAQLTAEEAFDKQPCHQQNHGKQHKPPVTHKLQDNCCFERFHFGEMLGNAQVIQ